MSVSESDLVTIGQRVNVCKRYVKELEKSPDRFTVAGGEALRLARARLRGAEKELKALKQAGQMRLLDAPLRDQEGKKR